MQCPHKVTIYLCLYSCATKCSTLINTGLYPCKEQLYSSFKPKIQPLENCRVFVQNSMQKTFHRFNATSWKDQPNMKNANNWRLHSLGSRQPHTGKFQLLGWWWSRHLGLASLMSSRHTFLILYTGSSSDGYCLVPLSRLIEVFQTRK